MNFLRTTKTETTQQRVWCSTGIRYPMIPSPFSLGLFSSGFLVLTCIFSPTGLRGRSFDNPCVLYSELEHWLDTVPGDLFSPPPFLCSPLSYFLSSLSVFTCCISGVSVPSVVQPTKCSALLRYWAREMPGESELDWNLTFIFLCVCVCVFCPVVGPGGADPELPETATPHHQQWW